MHLCPFSSTYYGERYCNVHDACKEGALFDVAVLGKRFIVKVRDKVLSAANEATVTLRLVAVTATASLEWK